MMEAGESASGAHVDDGEDSSFDLESLRRKYLEERAKRLRKDGGEQYVEIAGQFAHYLDDPYAQPDFERAPLQEDVEVVVVGGGFSGLMRAGNLKHAGIESFRIIERGGDFGGTWYWNRYPGAACDIESYIYMPFLEELGVVPTEKYVGSPEIMAHCQAIGRHFGLYEKTLFQTEANEFRWDDELGRWIVATSRGDTIRGRFLCVGSGVLHTPKLPGIAGIESFRGHSFHTSRWDYDYTGGDHEGGLTKLRDKRVAVIGTGATAVQIVPHLGRWAKELYVFQRTPSSIDVRNNRPTDPAWAETLEPGWQARRRDNFELALLGAPGEDLVADGWTDMRKFLPAPDPDGAPLSAEAIQMADFRKMEEIRDRVARIVKDPETAESLKPYYYRLCKRPCFHDEYLETFNRPNVTLVDTKGQGVERISETALIANGQTYEVDCIVYATGFEVGNERARKAMGNIHGRGGISLSDHWRDGLRSLHGMLVRDFPNLFLVAPGNQSALTYNFPHTIDMQARHAARIIKRCRDESIQTFEVREEAEDAWLDKVASNSIARRPVFQECTPGYFTGEGELAKSFLGNVFGGGPFVYGEEMDRWFEEGFERDLDIVRSSSGR